MQITIGTKIKELRKANKYTQEELANAIGVTPQAVSRWESGGSYPDVELIPSIANYFNVSIDMLFGYEYERTRKINELLSNVREKNKANNGVDVCVDECITTLRGALIEFPANESIMLCLADVLYNGGYVRFGEHHTTDADGFDVYDTAKNAKCQEWQETITIYEKLLSVLAEGSLRYKAVKSLNQLYAITGQWDKACSLARSAPDISSCREMLVLNSCDGQKRADEYKKTLSKLISVCSELLVSTVIINENHLSAGEAVKKVESAIGLFECVENKDECFDKLLNLHLFLSAHQWKNGESGKAFEALDTAKALAKRYDEKHSLTGSDSVAKELPEVWPWWSVAGLFEIEKEIKADPRWDKWVCECKN